MANPNDKSGNQTYINQEREEDLTVFQNINAQYTPSPHNVGRQFEFDSGFWSDVADEWNLSWVGQLKDTYAHDNGYTSGGIDKDYDPFDPDNLAGYEQYAGKFVDVINKDHHDFLKQKIDRNLMRRERLESSERGIMPALVAGLGDPINLIPIPFVKGISFGHKFVKGGLMSAGLVGATEPIRRANDPTASNQETAMYIGGAFLLGGLFSGALGKTVTRKTITEKGGINKISDNYFESHAKTEGRNTWENGWSYKVGDDAYNTGVEVSNTNSFTGKRYNPVVFQGVKSGNKLVVDETYLRNLYTQGKHLVSDIAGANPLPRKMFKTPDDYINFRMKKEIFSRLYTKRKKGEKLIDYENRLNDDVINDIIKINSAPRTTDTNKLLEFVEGWTNYGTVMKAFKDPYYARKMQELGGDFATAMRGNKEGVPTANSVIMDSFTKWYSGLRTTLQSIDDEFVAHRVGNGNSRKILDMNLQKGGIRAKDAINNFTRKFVNGRNQEVDPNALSMQQFYNKVSEAIVDDKVFDDVGLNPQVKIAATKARKFFAEYEAEATKLHMFASQGSYKRMMQIKAGSISQIDDLLSDKALNGLQIERLTKLKSRLQSEYRTLKGEFDEMAESISPPYEQGRNFMPRYWLRDKIMANPEAFKKILRRHFVANPIIRKKGKEVELSTSPEAIDKRVDDAFNKIIDNEANHMDGEGISGWGFDKNRKQWRAGTKSLMSRTLDIPNRDVIEFIETDINFIMRQYTTKMSHAIELTRQFGDRHLDDFLTQTEIRLITKELKKDKDNLKIDKVLNAFEDEKDKILGTLNTEDPASFSKRTAAFLRDWASLAFMGKVIFSALVDAARPVMVNGFSKTFKPIIGDFTTNLGAYSKALEQVKYFAPAMEVTLGSSRKRFIEDGGQVGLGKGWLSKKFDRFLGQPLNKAQGPFYFANLLTPWTQMWKQYQGVISSHRLIEDSLKVAKGTFKNNKEADFIKTRLASYGIDEKTAKLIADMPYEELDGLLMPNANGWIGKNGGQQAARKFRQALYADVNRTIITPTPTDQLNLMHGVFRVNDEAYAKLFDNNMGRFFGFQKTTRGGKFSNSYMGLPFQFFSWAIAANRKLLISGLQGRELQVMGGVAAMVSMGMMGDYFKNPRYWVQKPLEEKIIRGVELSGIAGIFTDANFMLETVSGGMFDEAVGIRPMLGQDLRFGDPNMANAVGEFIGAGPSIPADLLYAFMTDQDYDEKAATIRRIIPLNTLWIWDKKFKDIYNWGVEQIR